MRKKKTGELIPFGNRIIAKIIEKTETESGLLRPEGVEPEFSAWAEVVSIPDHKQSPFLKNIKIGDLVAYNHYAKDAIVHPDTKEKYLVLECEALATGLKGQVLAVIHKNNDKR